MAQDLAAFTKEIFPTAPDRIPLFPVDSQQRALAGLQRDIAEGLHLLCLTGPPGSGKTALLQTLQQTTSPGIVALIAEPTPGRLLFDAAKALRIDVPDDNESIVRRRLGMRLVSSEQRRNRPLLLIDSAERLLPEDLDLLFHFFPRGHASVVLASAADLVEWLGSTATTAVPQVDRSYDLGPLSAAETEGYIRHRLRESSLPDDLFQPDAIATIHEHSGGLPRRINQLCAETLARAGARGDDSVTASPVRQAAAQPPGEPTVPAPSGAPAVSPSPPPAPLVARRRRSAQPSQRMEPTLPPPEADAHPAYAPEPAAPRVPHRLQRRLRLWRGIAIVLSLMLIAALAATFGGTRNTPLLLGSETLQNALTQLSAMLNRGDGATGTTSGDAGGRTADSASGNAPAPVAPTAPADQPAAARTAPQPDAAAPPPPVAATEDPATTAQPSAADGATSAPAGETPEATAAGSPATPETPATAQPDTARGGEAEVRPEKTPQETASAPETPAPADARATADPTEQASVPERSEISTEAAKAASDGRATPARLPPAERARLGRLYAERADYEWRKGDVQAAYRSIQLGLASDPGNPVLLDMRTRLRNLLRGE